MWSTVSFVGCFKNRLNFFVCVCDVDVFWKNFSLLAGFAPPLCLVLESNIKC